MLITAKGKAMDKGAIGQSIRVQNTKNKLIVDAIVKGPDTVVVAYQNNTLVR
jgi:flagella basal body P-ring formation protein FlgA